MRIPSIHTLVLLSLPCACVLPGVDDGNGDGAGDSTGEPATSGTPGDTSAGPSGSGVDDSDDSGDSGDSGAAADTTGGGGGAFHCSEAEIVAGDPYFDGDFEGWNPAGQPIVGDPPLRMRHLAAAGDQLAIDTQFEIWLSDGTTVRRIAGDEGEIETQYNPTGSCAEARFITAEGIVGLPGGNIVVADPRGGGLIELRDPAGECTAAPYAGNPDQVFEVDIIGDAAAEGDIDGPGASARFLGVRRPTVDAEGNIFVVDPGNSKIKMIAADADHTVSTVLDYSGPDDVLVYAMTAFDGTLYISAATIVKDILWKIDLDTLERTVLIDGHAPFDELDSSHSAGLFGITNDGTDLYAVGSSGYLWRMTTDGASLGAVAGIGSVVDYPEGLQVQTPVPLDMVPLRSYGVNEADLLRMGDDLLFTGNANGIGFHLWAIHCGG